VCVVEVGLGAVKKGLRSRFNPGYWSGIGPIPFPHKSTAVQVGIKAIPMSGIAD
jgi:hypothetical protein